MSYAYTPSTTDSSETYVWKDTEVDWSQIVIKFPMSEDMSKIDVIKSMIKSIANMKEKLLENFTSGKAVEAYKRLSQVEESLLDLLAEEVAKSLGGDEDDG